MPQLNPIWVQNISHKMKLFKTNKQTHDNVRVHPQGGAGVLAGYPLDTVKVKIQTQDVRNGQTLYRGTFDCLFKLVRKDGVGGHLANVSPSTQVLL